MPTTPHIEQHFTGSRTVRDIVIGMSDGLTVPFALAAGLSGAVDSTRIVITAGLAEIAAGSIAMGLGGYLAAKSDLEHYESERAREQREVAERPDAEAGEVEQVFREYGLVSEQIAPILESPSGDVVHCGVTASASILKTHGDTRSRVRGASRRTHSEALGGATAERPQLRERPDLPLASSDRQGRFRGSLPRDATPSGCATFASLRQDH